MANIFRCMFCYCCCFITILFEIISWEVHVYQNVFNTRYWILPIVTILNNDSECVCFLYSVKRKNCRVECSCNLRYERTVIIRSLWLQTYKKRKKSLYYTSYLVGTKTKVRTTLKSIISITTRKIKGKIKALLSR